MLYRRLWAPQLPELIYLWTYPWCRSVGPSSRHVGFTFVQHAGTPGSGARASPEVWTAGGIGGISLEFGIFVRDSWLPKSWRQHSGIIVGVHEKEYCKQVRPTAGLLNALCLCWTSNLIFPFLEMIGNVDFMGPQEAWSSADLVCSMILGALLFKAQA